MGPANFFPMENTLPSPMETMHYPVLRKEVLRKEGLR